MPLTKADEAYASLFDPKSKEKFWTRYWVLVFDAQINTLRRQQHLPIAKRPELTRDN